MAARHVDRSTRWAVLDLAGVFFVAAAVASLTQLGSVAWAVVSGTVAVGFFVAARRTGVVVHGSGSSVYTDEGTWGPSGGDGGGNC